MHKRKSLKKTTKLLAAFVISLPVLFAGVTTHPQSASASNFEVQGEEDGLIPENCLLPHQVDFLGLGLPYCPTGPEPEPEPEQCIDFESDHPITIPCPEESDVIEYFLLDGDILSKCFAFPSFGGTVCSAIRIIRTSDSPTPECTPPGSCDEEEDDRETEIVNPVTTPPTDTKTVGGVDYGVFNYNAIDDQLAEAIGYVRCPAGTGNFRYADNCSGNYLNAESLKGHRLDEQTYCEEAIRRATVKDDSDPYSEAFYLAPESMKIERKLYGDDYTVTNNGNQMQWIPGYTAGSKCRTLGKDHLARARGVIVAHVRELNGEDVVEKFTDSEEIEVFFVDLSTGCASDQAFLGIQVRYYGGVVNDYPAGKIKVIASETALRIARQTTYRVCVYSKERVEHWYNSTETPAEALRKIEAHEALVHSSPSWVYIETSCEDDLSYYPPDIPRIEIEMLPECPGDGPPITTPADSCDHAAAGRDFGDKDYLLSVVDTTLEGYEGDTLNVRFRMWRKSPSVSESGRFRYGFSWVDIEAEGQRGDTPILISDHGGSSSGGKGKASHSAGGAKDYLATGWVNNEGELDSNGCAYDRVFVLPTHLWENTEGDTGEDETYQFRLNILSGNDASAVGDNDTTTITIKDSSTVPPNTSHTTRDEVSINVADSVRTEASTRVEFLANDLCRVAVRSADRCTGSRPTIAT